MIKTWQTIIIFQILLSIFILQATAENSFKFSQPEFKELIVEYSYPYMVSTYSDNQNIDFLKDQALANYNTPEDALLSFLSAMANKNYEWFLNSWTQKDRAKIITEDKEKGWDQEFFYIIWDKMLNGKSLKLLKRIERNQYVYIGYALVPDDHGSDDKPESLAFVYENNSWHVTNAALCDPVLTGWNTPDQKIRRPGKIGKFENQCNP